MPLATSVWALIGQHALSFLGGLVIGLAASSRYRIVRVERRNGDPPKC